MRPTSRADERWISAFTKAHWGAEYVVAHGTVYFPDRLSGFVAENADGAVVGLATYSIEQRACELVTMNAVDEGLGIGTELLNAVVAAAKAASCTRLWLVTTNDNVAALGFYQKRGMRVAALHPDAVTRARALKPSIPLAGSNGIPIRDELELELLLDDARIVRPDPVRPTT